MLNAEMRKTATLVSGAIDQFLPVVHPRGLYEASRHPVTAHGKRLRPFMLLKAGEAVGGDPIGLLPAATSIELVHNYSLIHDDIIDNGEIRHGLPTVHTLWGIPGAILAGDTLNAKAFQILNLVKAENGLKLAAMDILFNACTTICEGQWLDLEFVDKEKVSEEEYLEMIEKKTGALFGASASIGAVLSNGSAETVERLKKFGKLTGMGFQLQDDVLDLTGTEKFGKKHGKDLIEGKKTLIMIHALDHGVNLDVFGKKDATSQEIDLAQSILEESGSLDFVRAKAVEFTEKGKQALDTLPESDAKSTLLKLADFMIGREY